MNILFLLHVLLDVFFCISLVWCARMDFKKRIIPNRATLIILIISAVQIVLLILNRQPVMGYLASLIMFMPMYLWWKKGKMGGGDLKLFTVCSLYLGLLFFTGALAITFLLAVILLKSLKKKVPLAVYYAPGAVTIIALQYVFMCIW